MLSENLFGEINQSSGEAFQSISSFKFQALNKKKFLILKIGLTYAKNLKSCSSAIPLSEKTMQQWLIKSIETLLNSIIFLSLAKLIKISRLELNRSIKNCLYGANFYSFRPNQK